MKRYIFSRKKLQEDSDVWDFSKSMYWPKDADGCEAFFPDGEEKGYAITQKGYEVIVYPEWCEVFDENQGAPTAALTP